MGGPGIGRGMGGPGMAMGGPKPSLRKALGVLGDRNYLYLFLSSAGGFVGMNMQQVARGVLAWELTGSFALTGLVTLSFALPMLLFSLIGGAVADRVNKRNLQLVQQSLTGVLALVTAVLVLTDTITIELLFIVGLIQGTFFAFGMPARTPLMAQVVGPQNLMAAIALSTASMNATRLVGPAAAGILIGIWGIEAAYFAQAAMYLVTVPLILLVPSYLGESIEEYEEDGQGGWIVQRRQGMFSEIRAGLGYVARDATIRRLMVLGFITTLFGMPYVMLLPGFVDRDLGLPQSGLGYLMTVTGVGALFGSLLVASFTEYDRKPFLQLGNALAAGVGLLALGVLTISFGLPGVIVALLITGFAFSAFQTLNNTMVIGASNPAYQGRVMSIYMLTFSAMPIMAAPLGFAADVTGAPVLFIFLGAMISVLFLLSAVINPRYTFGRHDDRPKWGPRGMPGAAGAARPSAPHAEAVAVPVATEAPPPQAVPAPRPLAAAMPAAPRGRRDYMHDGSPHPRRNYMAAESPANGNGSNGAGGNGTNGNGAGERGTPIRVNRPRDYGVGEANGGWTSAREYGLEPGDADDEPTNGHSATNGNGNTPTGALASASPVRDASPVASPSAARPRREIPAFEVWTAPESPRPAAPVATPPEPADTPAPEPDSRPALSGGRYSPPTEWVDLPPRATNPTNGARNIVVTGAVAAAASAIGALLLGD
jgi:MFS family permease